MERWKKYWEVFEKRSLACVFANRMLFEKIAIVWAVLWSRNQFAWIKSNWGVFILKNKLSVAFLSIQWRPSWNFGLMNKRVYLWFFLWWTCINSFYFVGEWVNGSTETYFQLRINIYLLTLFRLVSWMKWYKGLFWEDFLRTIRLGIDSPKDHFGFLDNIMKNRYLNFWMSDIKQ